MYATWSKRSSHGVFVSTLLICGWLTPVTFGWQFRDLDHQSAEVADDAAELIDLVPADEENLAPVVDADGTDSRLVKRAPHKVASKQSPGVDDSSGMLQPVPMPELQKQSAPREKRAAEPSVVKRPSSKSSGDTPAATTSESVESLVSSPADHDSTSLDTDVETAEFKGVRPGSTTLAELQRQWGDAVETTDQNEANQTLVYQIDSFQQVDVQVNDEDIVTSLLIHLESALPASQVEQDFDLSALEPVPIPDEYGEVLGQGYPERGLLFSFTDDLDSLDVAAILIEPVSAEMFRLRAQYDFDHQYTRSLGDLQHAIILDSKDAQAHWLKAELLDTVGRTREAIRSANKAIRLRPTDPLYRITRARLYAKTNQSAVAIDELQEVLDEIDMPANIEARAQLLIGDLKAMGPDGDHQEALKHHLKAIDLASGDVDSNRFVDRRAAKHILIDAHVSVARDIALGNFQRQHEVVPKWLLRATELADEYITDDYGEELLQLNIYRDTLAVYAELLEANFDAALASEEALRTARNMISEATDELHKTQLERILAETLLHSVKIARARGRYDAAMTYANNALALIDNSEQQWQELTHDRYLRGQLYFAVGSIHAVGKDNHQQAADWYSKAGEVMADSEFFSPLFTTRGHGEMYVSMGLSFWQTGQHDKALALTQAGADLMKQAVEQGALKMAALAVPFGNLATMHDKLGNETESKEFAELVAKVENSDPAGVTR